MTGPFQPVAKCYEWLGVVEGGKTAFPWPNQGVERSSDQFSSRLIYQFRLNSIFYTLRCSSALALDLALEYSLLVVEIVPHGVTFAASRHLRAIRCNRCCYRMLRLHVMTDCVTWRGSTLRKCPVFNAAVLARAVLPYMCQAILAEWGETMTTKEWNLGAKIGRKVAKEHGWSGDASSFGAVASFDKLESAAEQIAALDITSGTRAACLLFLGMA